MQPIRVTLFGAPQVEVDGAQPAVSRRKVLALLAYLACTGRAHSRDELLALLWPDYDPSSARANLRRDLSRLNQWLGGTGLEASRLQVRLDLSAGLWVDVNEFRTRLDQAQKHAHLPGELCPECLLALTQATELYQDHFMAGFGLSDSPAFDEWQFFESNSLRQGLAGALQRLVAWNTRQREYDLAIPHARRWLSLDSLHEPAQRELMSLYALAGQQAAALRQYQECARLLKQELGLKPEIETTELYEAIRTRKFPADREPVPSLSAVTPANQAGSAGSPLPPHNLPVQMTPTLGRADELNQIMTRLKGDPTCRLLTLTGPGGSGKTRLAIQAGFLLAEDETGSFPDGIWFVQLAPLAEADSLLTAVAEVLDFSFLGETAPRSQQLFDHLRPKHLLLILDNFEHLLGAQATDWVNDLLQTAPQVKILSTSRTRLNILGEQIFEVQGLQVPADSVLLSGQVTADELLSYSAVQLFLEAGRRQLPEFEITSENQNAVVRICRLVEGVPLGIELAAAWLDMLTPAGIASEIERSLDFLEAEWASLPERQRSLRAVFNGSWQLLDAQEQSAMKCLSVFPGSVTIQAAQAVSGAPIKILRELVHKSWLKHASRERFQVHELLRQYAAEQLQAETQEAVAVTERYAAYYAAFLEEQARLMRGPRQEEMYQSIGVDFENLRLAWKLCLDRGWLDLAIENMLPAIFFFCEARLRAYDLLQFVDLALQSLDAATTSSGANGRSAVILQVARAGFFRNGYPVRFEAFGMFIPADESAIQNAWISAQQAGIQADLELWSIYLAYLYGRIIEQHTGAELLRSLVDQYRRQDREWELAFSLYSLGNLNEVILFDVADTPELRDETERCLLEALSIYQARGDRRESANTQRTLGNLYRLMAQDGVKALHHWRAARAAMIANGDWALAAGVSWQIGDLHLRLGEFEAAFEEFTAMTRTYHERGYPQFEAYSLSKQSLEASRHGDLDHARTLRMQALEISHRTDDLYGEAWSSWELGEIYRLSGDLPAARTWFETAQRQFERFDDQSGSIFYQRGLGDMAQAEGDYRRSFEYFQESLDWAQRLGHDWGAAYALAGIGRAALGLDQQEDARKAFTEALRLTQSNKVNDPGLKLIALTGLASLAAAAGKIDQAARLASLVAGHRLSWQETRRQAQEILERIPDLPAERRAELAEASKGIDLLEFTRQILAGMSNKDEDWST